MIFVLLLLGLILIVAAIRNTQGTLFTALGADVPAFFVWGAAILALGAIGFIPGLKPVSRGLLALVLVVLVLHNYQGIISGFQNAGTIPATPSGGTSSSPSSPSFWQKLLNPGGSSQIPLVG